MSSLGDNTLLELLREEVRGNVQVLTGGLVELEQDVTNVQRIEPLMRAAHSIKGAARVVGVEPAVRVAHVMEDCLVAAQHGKLILSAAAIDVLLRAADWLGQLGNAIGEGFDAWVTANNAGLQEIVAALESVRANRMPPAPVEATPAQSVGTPATLGSTEAVPETAAAPPVRMVEPEPARASAAAPKSPTVEVSSVPARGDSKDGVVRVAAQSLTRLMGLAGESLVEARWLRPFADSLLTLKREQDRLADMLDESTESKTRLAACREMLSDRIAAFENHARRTEELNSRLYAEVVASRMRPFGDGVHGFPRLVRDVARELGKKVRFEIVGELTPVDRDVLEKLDAPLTHLIRNAIDHAIELPTDRVAAGKSETGLLRLEARHSAGMLAIQLSDDGRGIDIGLLRSKVVQRQLTTSDMAARLSDMELLDFLFLPGFSTRDQVTELSGRGVGLDVVRNMVHSVGGSVRIQTQLGVGTVFSLQMPITLSVIRAVLVEIAGELYAFPHNRIDRLLRLPRTELRSLEGREYFTLDGRNVSVVSARQIFRSGAVPPQEDLCLVLFGHGANEYALAVDAFRGEQDLVVRPLDARLGKVPNIDAAAILDDGSPALIVDLDDTRHSIERLQEEGRLERTQTSRVTDSQRPKRVLVVDDSITVREVERQLLAAQGYDVAVAVDGVDGWNLLRDGGFDLVVSDIDMPRMDGLTLTRHIKEDPKLQSIPVVIVSYKDRDEDRLRGLEAGANYYLTKGSFHDDSLLEAVDNLIGSAMRSDSR